MTIALSVFYAYIAGMGVPIVRAVLMLSMFLFARLLYRDRIGLDKLLARMKDFQAKMGDAFKPSALLEKLVAEGKKFADVK